MICDFLRLALALGGLLSTAIGLIGWLQQVFA
jgi:hypothetical protein